MSQPCRWLVLSPHCDDAVLSLGASLSANVRGGGSATVVTFLAGSTTSVAPAGTWDAAGGFVSEGAAARARRAEDEAACRILGVRAVHLGGVDQQYGPAPDESDLWSAFLEQVARHDVVFLPGAPLSHPDHRRLAERAEHELAPSTVVRLYGEEPYLLLAKRPPPEGRRPVRWERAPAALADCARKLRAVRCYRSQLRLLAGPIGSGRLRTSPIRLLARMFVRSRRGEWLGEPG